MTRSRSIFFRILTLILIIYLYLNVNAFSSKIKILNFPKEAISKSYGEYFFGFIFDNKVFIDETHEYNDYESPKAKTLNRIWEQNSNRIIEDETGWHYIEFNSLISEFQKYTSLRLNDILYISTIYGVFNLKLDGYALMTRGSGAKFYDMFSVNEELNKNMMTHYLKSFNTIQGDEEKDNNFVILSTSSDISEIKNDGDYNGEIDKYLKAFRKKLVFLKENGGKFEEFSENIKIFKFNMNSGDNIFAASYVYKYEGIYANAVFLLNENGKIINTLREFKTPGKNDLKKYNYEKFGEYYSVLGTIDVNSDGIDELILYNGSYEGGSYELWGLEDGRFNRITNGLVEGT